MILHGDNGITAIAGALHKSGISKLDISECGITVTGAKALAESMLINNSITCLNVQDNLMTVEGIRMILQ